MNCTAVYLTIGMGLESPPIRRGCRARKVWRYLQRIGRLEAKGRAMSNLTQLQSCEIGGAVGDTMEHLECLGIEFDDYGRWRDRLGKLPRMTESVGFLGLQIH